MMVYNRSGEVLDGATFRRLRDEYGAWLETDHPDQIRLALSLMENESLGVPCAT